MVIANVSDGTTRKFDLSEAPQHRALLDLISSGKVSALSLHHNGTQHVLALPRRFRATPVFGVEVLADGGRQVGERIFAQVGDVRVSVSLTYGSKLVRCDLVRVGWMKYNGAQGR